MFMAILLRESDVDKLANIEMALDAVEEAFMLQGDKKADNAPRRRCRLSNGLLHVMSASLPTLGYAGLKSYTSVDSETRFHVVLYGAEKGQLLAILEADLLGRLRTGAASGIATKFMARKNSSTLGILGTGSQARSQLAGICAVRPIKNIVAYGRNRANLESFCSEMSGALGIKVEAASAPEQAVRNMDIVVTATNSKTPVFSGEWLAPGTHINAIGANHVSRCEIDAETVRRAACVVVDSAEQSLLESGDLAQAAEAEAFYWEDARELGLVVIGEYPGREDDSEITLFKSNGIALEDIAIAGRIYQAALKAGVGTEIPL
jgi:ornithine cyclodeaminase/alanine dehydrogenase-like protein (mu-crystallin family)